ncbi:UNVERIFIED_CONTAM: hypothetical protein Slati_1692300 [Sesamum latifolium]|uniref:Uncharacterized protein n=1 Tax=Sesamum latifolium TaxID=2727402 RepID=A0AAW2WVI8_9LAMI
MKRCPEMSRELFCHDISAEGNTSPNELGFLPYLLAELHHQGPSNLEWSGLAASLLA